MKSLDPRVSRLDQIREEMEAPSVGAHDYWQTWEVFHQDKRGKRHEHVGTVHAPDPEMALVFAKEQFGRRQQTVNLWVVKTTDVFGFPYEDSDMFETTPEKTHREASGYKTRDKIEAYKKKQKEGTNTL